MNGFFEAGKKYCVRVADLHSPDAETFSVSLNDMTGRYGTNEDVVMPGELINVLLDATVPHEITKMERGYPRIVGVKLRPRFSVTPVGLPTVPLADATIVTPGVSAGTGVLGGGFTPPSDYGAELFDPREGAEPEPEADEGGQAGGADGDGEGRADRGRPGVRAQLYGEEYEVRDRYGHSRGRGGGLSE